jgi:hypothetical protein
MNIISHRGLWNNKIQKNSLEAFKLSFSEDFGVETDIRDFNGKLVVSHNIADLNCDLLQELFKIYKASDISKPLALNVKADGLQSLVSECLDKYNIDNYFLFDMSIPEQYVYIKQGLKVFSRQSDIEKTIVLYDDVYGVWLDAFIDEWVDEATIKYHINNDKKVCIVSPELHGRKYKERWEMYKNIDNNLKSNQLILCTDYPIEARSFFNEQ